MNENRPSAVPHILLSIQELCRVKKCSHDTDFQQTQLCRERYRNHHVSCTPRWTKPELDILNGRLLSRCFRLSVNSKYLTVARLSLHPEIWPSACQTERVVTIEPDRSNRVTEGPLHTFTVSSYAGSIRIRGSVTVAKKIRLNGCICLVEWCKPKKFMFVSFALFCFRGCISPYYLWDQFIPKSKLPKLIIPPCSVRFCGGLWTILNSLWIIKMCFADNPSLI